MRGNQTLINTQILEHKDNPIKDPIGKLYPLDIIHMINHEYWKEWRRQLTFSDKPHIQVDGLGKFSLMFGKSKYYLRRLIQKIRLYKQKYPDKYMIPGTKENDIYMYYVNRFRATWKQVDNYKIEVNARYKRWNDKKVLKYGDKAIL